MVNFEWQGWSSGYYHAFMLGALLFSSLRWVTVKYAGESVPASAMIFWEPIMVLLVMGSIIDLAGLLNKPATSIINPIASNTIIGSQKIIAEVGILSPAYLTVIQRNEENNNAPSINAW